jgi:hypothetical protein
MVGTCSWKCVWIFHKINPIFSIDCKFMSADVFLQKGFQITLVAQTCCVNLRLHSGGYESSIFWDIMPCRPLKVNRLFRETHHLHLQGRRISACHMFSYWFLAWLILQPWRWCQILLWRVSWLSMDYMMIYPRLNQVLHHIKVLSFPCSCRFTTCTWTWWPLSIRLKLG